MEKRGKRRERILNLATAVAVAAALSVIVHDRLIPAWNERRRIDLGEFVPAGLALHRLADSSRVPLAPDRPTLLLVYRSTCPACGRAAPLWRSLIANFKGVTLAVALEAPRPGLSYATSMLPGAVPVRPASARDFADRFRIEAIPTTLLIDGRGTLALRHVGVPGPAVAAQVLGHEDDAAVR